MKKKHRNSRFLILILLMAFSGNICIAQEETETISDITTEDYIISEEEGHEEYPVEETPQPVEIKTPEYPKADEEKVWNDDEWKEASKDLEYSQEPEEEELEEDTDDTNDVSSDPMDTNSIGDWLEGVVTSPLGKIIAIAVIAILLFLLIARLLAVRTNNAQLRDRDPEEELALNLEEIPEEHDLDYFLKKALDSGDYKTAVRILYLFVIRQMDAQSLIKWKKDKTNRDYLMEMRAHEQYRRFREITNIYEVVWYGDVSISQLEYSKVSEYFTGFKKSIEIVEEK